MRAWTALGLVLIAGCLRPPILLDPYGFQEHNTHINYPPGHQIESIELREPDGEPVTLRGIYVPGEPGAGIVVQFQETSISVGSDHLGYGPYAESMRDLGLHYMLIDYRGVGLSSGKRRSDHISPDAHRIVDRALEKVGGDRSKLVLRGTSLGTIVISQLLDEGVKPAGVVLLLPVRSASAVQRYAREFSSPVEIVVAEMLLQPISESDPLDLMRRTALPLLVYTPSGDPLIHREEREEILHLGRQGQLQIFEPNHRDPWIRQWIGEQGMTTHETGCIQAHGPIELAELDLYERLGLLRPALESRLREWWSQLPREIRTDLEQDPQAMERLRSMAGYLVRLPPEWAAAAAVSGWEPRLAAQIFRVARNGGRFWRGADWDALRRCMDLRDPQADIPLRLIERNLFTVRGYRGLAAVGDCVDAVLSQTARNEEQRLLREYAAEDLQWIRACVADPESVRRLYTRLLLKASRRAPDRVTSTEDGRQLLEVWTDAGWLPFAEAVRRDRQTQSPDSGD